MADPILLETMRRHPEAEVRVEWNGQRMGTTARGFVAEYDDAVAAARAEVLAKVREFPPLMADAWGGDQSWLTTGTKVADLVADWLGADLDDALVADLGGDHG